MRGVVHPSPHRQRMPSWSCRGAAGQSAEIETDIPARLDFLPWSRFHTLIVIALGVTWILDGLEVTLAGSLSGALKDSPRLHFSNTEIGMASSAYLVGSVLGAILFGWLTDRLGRKKLFFITLSVYLVATAATAFSCPATSFTRSAATSAPTPPTHRSRSSAAASGRR